MIIGSDVEAEQPVGNSTKVFMKFNASGIKRILALRPKYASLPYFPPAAQRRGGLVYAVMIDK